MFDNDPFTLGRTLQANPLVIELEFPTPRQISGLSVTVSSASVEISVELYEPGEEVPVIYTHQEKGSVDNPVVSFNFDETITTEKLRLRVLDTGIGEPGHVHVWEIVFK
jgi:hypothetical protein